MKLGYMASDNFAAIKRYCLLLDNSAISESWLKNPVTGAKRALELADMVSMLLLIDGAMHYVTIINYIFLLPRNESGRLNCSHSR